MITSRVIARTPPPAFLFPDQRFQRPEPEAFQSDRLAPGLGGGGDLVASEVRVKRSFRRTISFFRAPPKRGRRVFTASFSCVKRFFLKKNRSLQDRPGRRWRRVFSASDFRVKRFFFKKNLSLRARPGGRRRRLSKEGRSPCQPGFSAILRSVKTEAFRPQKTARRRAERLPSVFVSDDSIGARNLTKPPFGSKGLSALFSGGAGRLSSPWPRRPARFRARRRYTQGPFPPQPDSEAFLNFLVDSRSLDGARRRGISPPLYMCAGIPPRGWLPRSGI